MCEFFSFCSDGKGNYYYADWELRKKILKGEIDLDPDSHSGISTYFGFKGSREDRLNKYEYCPFTGKFLKDEINIEDDSVIAEDWVKRLDFKKVVEPLMLKPIVHPFKLKNKKILKSDKDKLKVWASVRASVWDSVGDSVWDSVGAYTSSYVRLDQWKYTEKLKYKKGENPFQSCIDLWERGFVPSFDGKVYRLHQGPKAKIVYTWNPKEPPQ